MARRKKPADTDSKRTVNALEDLLRYARWTCYGVWCLVGAVIGASMVA